MKPLAHNELGPDPRLWASEKLRRLCDTGIPLVTVTAMEPVTPEFYLNATDEQWDAEMCRRYGPEDVS